MKRFGNLWNTFISESNIRSAIRKSIKGKRSREDVMLIIQDEDKIIKEIQYMLINGKVPKHRYRKIVIYEGKKRNIYVIDFYPWRIIHHMVINVIEPIFENSFIDHTYGCIRGRGQFKGSKHCWEMVKRYEYCLKCDIKKFYPSIYQEILSELIHKKIKDKKLLNVIDEIVFSHSKGCPIGNLPSQLFGNIYLSQLDYFCKHELRFKNYIRYVDDFLFFSNDKKELQEVLRIITDWLKENLGLLLSKHSVFKTKQGVDFLGYRHFKNYKLLRKKTAQRFMRKVNRLYLHYGKDKTLEQCMSVLSSIDGWIKNCNSYNLSKKLNTDKVREDLTFLEFQKQNPFICGINEKILDTDVIVNAYSIQENYIKVQYKYNDRIYYLRSKNETIRKQFKQVNKADVPFICQFKDYNGTLYAA